MVKLAGHYDDGSYIIPSYVYEALPKSEFFTYSGMLPYQSERSDPGIWAANLDD